MPDLNGQILWDALRACVKRDLPMADGNWSGLHDMPVQIRVEEIETATSFGDLKVRVEMHVGPDLGAPPLRTPPPRDHPSWHARLLDLLGGGHTVTEIATEIVGRSLFPNRDLSPTKRKPARKGRR